MARKCSLDSSIVAIQVREFVTYQLSTLACALIFLCNRPASMQILASMLDGECPLVNIVHASCLVCSSSYT